MLKPPVSTKMAFCSGYDRNRGRTDNMEVMMKDAPQIYVLTLGSPSRKVLRLWTGKTIHTLRHCSVKQIGSALVEMQQRLEDLQETKTTAVPIAPSQSYSLNRTR